MSAAADSTTTGGAAAPGHDSGLEQPTGAVQMKNIPQASEADGKSSDEATDDAAQNASVDATASAGPVSTDHSEAPAAPSAKGKEVGTSSGPLAEPAAPKEKDGRKDETTEPAPQVVTQQEPPKEQERAPRDVPPKDEKSKEEKQEDSAMAIGPADEEIKPAGSGTDSGPVCNITLLLASGSRHPYKIDAKYLSKRHVAMPDEDENGKPDPFSISIYTLKELILREWRSDWEAKPASPTSIRLIHFGKLLDDKEQLKKYQFSHDSPNVVHMSIRPQDLDEEEPKTGSKSLPAGAADGDRTFVLRDWFLDWRPSGLMKIN
ncbi:hypothetical protein MKX07_008368 [Trichoderma sp. CBMAI-0711]|uniref:UBL3-like ubiquitin domain-containing protein n=1 Tax=Trichoderma parareesei TaxID=858221 RepID=A0A2H2Z1B3_TRIPA|nr:hypothetical protein MKX07_008368 [Trichoderma sp. CBMAI-0711]OTA00498.1 hypothetical protein A9Z42_0006500 [Trichoderma parareesei]